jgi:hypothetical protein
MDLHSDLAIATEHLLAMVQITCRRWQQPLPAAPASVEIQGQTRQ